MRGRGCGDALPGLRLGFGGGRHGRVPIEQAAATVAGEQLALAKLVPGLRANAHAAAGALLIINAGKAGAARGGEAVEADEPLGLDQRAEGFALGVEGGQFGVELLLAEGDAGAGLVQGAGQRLQPGRGLRRARLPGLQCAPGWRTLRFPGDRLRRIQR